MQVIMGKKLKGIACAAIRAWKAVAARKVKDGIVESEAEMRLRAALIKAWDLFSTWLTILVVALAVYCCIGTMNQSKTGELFFPFGYRAVQILSGSMEETLKTGSVVIVKQTKDVRENDIIFFVAEDETLVIHRYVNTDEAGNLITKGDANPKEDLEPLTPERLHGKVILKMNWLSGITKLAMRLRSWFVSIL